MKLKLTPTHDLENAQIYDSIPSHSEEPLGNGVRSFFFLYDYLIERSTSLDKDAKLPKTHVSHILHRT